MCTAIGAIGIIVGMAAVFGAARYPVHRIKLETWGGGLFVIGVAFLALNFPLV